MHLNHALAIAAASGLATAALAQDDQTAKLIADLQSQLTELTAEVDKLRARDQDWLTVQRADEIRSIVADVLADADTRASLAQDGVNAGYKGGFFIASSDGSFRLRIRGQIQARWALATGSSLADNPTYGFEMRRVKLKFDGHVIDPTWKYVINLAADQDDKQFSTGGGGGTIFSGQGDVDLQDAIIKKDFGDGLELWVGQFKLPFLQEELISSTRQQVVERSLVNGAFNQSRSKGVMLAYTGDRFRVQGSFSDGFDSENTPFNYMPTMPGSMGSSLSGTARVDWLGAGEWGQFEEPTSPPGSDFACKIGGAAHYEYDKYNTTQLPPGVQSKSSRFTWTIDGMVEGDGWNIFTYVVANHVKTGGGAWMNTYGAVGQGGYYLTDDVEAYARYEWGGGPGVPGPDLNVLTVGANYYIKGQQLKWTSDVGVAFTAVTGSWDSGGADWLVSATAGEVVVRSQFQLLF